MIKTQPLATAVMLPSSVIHLLMPTSMNYQSQPINSTNSSMAPQTKDTNTKNQEVLMLVILVGSACIGLLLLCVLTICLVRMFRQNKSVDRNGWTLVDTDGDCANTSSLDSVCDLPDLDNSRDRGGMFRQSSLPPLQTRQQSLYHQMSLNLSNVEFSIKNIERKEQPSLGMLKPDLYTLSSDDIQAGGDRPAHGTLSFSLSYNYKTEHLIVYVTRADGLPARDFSGTSDPYIKIYLLPDRKNKYQTRVHRKTLNPEFNEIFSFQVAVSQLEDRMLQFSVYDFDRFSRHDLIGTVVVGDLTDGSDLAIEREYCMDIICSKEDTNDLGEIMFSLCYLPTAGRLTCTIIKARNLKAMDITGASDPYVKVSLLQQGKRVKKRKTSVKKSTLNPVYNEAIVFDVIPEQMEGLTLLITVVDYDRIGHSEPIGCVEVGSTSPGLGTDHWNEMLQCPRKPVAYWYSLADSCSASSNPSLTGTFCITNGTS